MRQTRCLWMRQTRCLSSGATALRVCLPFAVRVTKASQPFEAMKQTGYLPLAPRMQEGPCPTLHVRHFGLHPHVHLPTCASPHPTRASTSLPPVSLLHSAASCVPRHHHFHPLLAHFDHLAAPRPIPPRPCHHYLHHGLSLQHLGQSAWATAT